MLLIEIEMAESEAIQIATTQTSIHGPMTAMIVRREADAVPTTIAKTANSGEACRQRNGRPALKQMSCNWNTPGKYVELLSSKM